MAGREVSGFENSISTLFDGASMILTPDDDILLEDIEDISEFFNSLGFGQIEVTTPERHDEIIAYTSQLAHIISNAYVQNPAARDYVGLSAGSFADLTRVAKLDEDMWTELFILNNDNLERHLRLVIDKLVEFHEAIAKKNKSALKQMLCEGRETKEHLDLL